MRFREAATKKRRLSRAGFDPRSKSSKKRKLEPPSEAKEFARQHELMVGTKEAQDPDEVIRAAAKDIDELIAGNAEFFTELSSQNFKD